MAVYRRAFEVSHKADDSPLTEADLAAHHCIAEGLQALQPRLPLLSEEDADIPAAVRRQWTHYWLVDPLDGTREFIKRNGEFTVNIALIAHGRPVLGVVHVPALAQTYAAAQGLGAWRQQGEDRQPLHTRRWPSRPVLFVSRSHHGRRADAALSRFPPHEQESKGSSLKFCLIAEGSADGYPRLGPTSEWDTAAAQCVVEQAGGAVLALPTLTPLQYNQGDGLINPDFVVVGDRQAPWRQWLQQAGAAERRA